MRLMDLGFVDLAMIAEYDFFLYATSWWQEGQWALHVDEAIELVLHYF